MNTSTCSRNTKPAVAVAPTLAAKQQSAKTEAAHDAILVERFNSGDESAFTEIVNRYYARIRSLAHQTLHDFAEAEEIAQDTFIRAHRGLASFRGNSSLFTWLYRIALNLSRNRYWYFFRRHHQDSVSIDQPLSADSDVALSDMLLDRSAGPRTETITTEFSTLVNSCLDRLNSGDREIITMRSLLYLSYDEIATSLRINVGTVKSRIARARERLRSLLLQAAPEFGQETALDDFFEVGRPPASVALAV